MVNKTEKELQRLALDEWLVFKSLVGESAITKAMVIILRKQGLSYGQISTRLKISRQWAQEIFYKYHEASVSNDLTE
jgi:carbamoylphosphate synthase small subunit